MRTTPAGSNHRGISVAALISAVGLGCRWDEKSRDLAQQRPLSRTEKAVVTHFDKAFGKDVLQKTTQEFHRRQRAQPPLSRTGRAITKGDAYLGNRHQAAVGESDAKDIARQISEGPFPATDRLAMDHPILPPDFAGDVRKTVGAFEGVAEPGSEENGQCLDWKQEAPVPAIAPDLTIPGAGGDEEMDVGMVGEVASPGVQDAHHTNAAAEKLRVLSQLLRSGGRGAKEQVVDGFLLAARQGTEGGREGESEQKVGHRQQHILLSGQPLLRLVLLALRAMTVAAGMVAVLGMRLTIFFPGIMALRGC